jgi:elongation factor G
MPRDIALDRVRNIGVMAHIDAGKTTITERVLFFTGRIHRKREVHHGNTAMDFSPEEQAMGITINAAATTTHWAVRDGAVAVFDAARGVEAQTETVWRQADRYGVARIAFVNKVDKPGADLAMCLESMRRRLGARPVAVQLPLDAGLIDLVRDRAVVYDDTGRTFVVTAVPAEHRAAATRAREQLIEACAECDPSLTDAYLAGGPDAVSADDIERALRVATIAGRLVPVLCGSVLKNRGIQMLLDAVVNYLPSPHDLPAVEGTHPDTGLALVREARDDGPVCALAFKVVSDRAQGTLPFLRVYSGTVRPGMALLDTRRGRTERVGRLVLVHADERESIDEAPAGAIAAVLGWRDVRTGTTLCSADEPMPLVGLTIPEPMVEVALEPRTAGDSDRMTAGLARLAHEDPSLHVGTDPESGQTVVKGMGELHLEIVVVIGLEPVMAVEVTVPEDCVGEALASVQSRRGTVRDLRARGASRVVDAAVPLARLFGYVTELRSRTQGRGSAVLAFSRYDATTRG